VGREPEDALAWMEVDQMGLSAVRCQVAVEQDGTWSSRWSGVEFRWSQVLSRGEPGLAARGGAVLNDQCSVAHGIDLGAKVGLDAHHRGHSTVSRAGGEELAAGAWTEGCRSYYRVW
jgi:hypothetical protein